VNETATYTVALKVFEVVERWGILKESMLALSMAEEKGWKTEKWSVGC